MQDFLRSKSQQTTEALIQQGNAMGMVANASDGINSSMSSGGSTSGGWGPASDLELASGHMILGGQGSDPQSNLQFWTAKLDQAMAERRVLTDRLRPENWIGTIGTTYMPQQGSTQLSYLNAAEETIRQNLAKARGQMNVNVVVNGMSLIDQGSIQTLVRDTLVPVLRQTSLAAGAGF